MFIKAFERKLTFIIGTSVTTGKPNTVVWSGIHHKSSTYGGSSNFGFPDQDYFKRVTQELRDRGVSIEEDDEIHKFIDNSVGSRYILE